METRGFKVTAKYVDTAKGFPNSPDDTMYHNKFRVTVIKDGIRRSFDFYDSAANCEKGIDTLDDDSLKSALYSFLSDGEGGKLSFEDFCAEFGYDGDSLSAYRIWKLCQKSTKKLEGFGLSEDELIDHMNALDS